MSTNRYTGLFGPQTQVKYPKIRAPRDPNAPKRQRGRPRKDDTGPRVKRDGQDSASTSATDSEDDMFNDNEPPDPKPALLVVNRPTEVIGRAMYDALSAVWAPKNKPPVWENVTNGMALFADAIKSLRDSWKIKNEALKKAELSNSAQVSELKLDVAKYRDRMEQTMQRSLQFGHEAHLNRYVIPKEHPERIQLHSLALIRAL